MNESYFAANLRRRDWPRALNVALAELLAGALAFSRVQTARLADADARVNAVIQKAFYETCELTEGLSGNLRKLLVTTDAAQRQALLNEAALQTQGALSNLALLPLGQEAVAATLKFVNQTGDFTGTLSRRLAGGGELTGEDAETLRALSDAAALFASGLAGLLERWERGEVDFSGAGSGAEGDLLPLTNPATDYPVLLYDGPFSDGRAGGEFRALEGLEEVSEPQARAALAAFVGEGDLEVTFTGHSAIPEPCYEYALRLGDYRLSAGVTRRGGRVLYLLCDSQVTRASLTEAQAVRRATDFLAARGFGDMSPSYSSRYGNILTVNLAATQEGVILYPDLVKVQVSLSDGRVVGLETAGYLMNHVPRALKTPALTEDQALERVSGALLPTSARLCLIPDGEGEALCYEIRATGGEDTFLVYLDADTGAERRLMQVVESPNGELVR